MSSTNLLPNAVTRFRETSFDLLEYAKANREEGTFNDVTLQVDDSSIGANRMVLACHSTYFEKMFKSEMRERYESNISVTGVDGKTAVTLIDYMYNEQITIDNESVMNILAGADYFQLNDVKTFCFDYLMERIASDNWCDLLTAAKLYTSDQLQKQVYKFIEDHFDEVIQTIDFKTLTKDDLISFVLKLNRNHVEESSIYQAVVNWIKHNEEERNKEFPDLFQLIELNRLSSNTLQGIASENLVHGNVTCAKSVLTMLSKVIKEKETKENESKIIMIGGTVYSDKVTEIFNCYGIEPESYPDLPYNVHDHSLLKLHDAVFCIGGTNSNEYENIYDKVFQMKLNETHLTWIEFVSMNEKRRGMGAAVFCNHLVVAGGSNGTTTLASTEYFNHSLDKWQVGPTMKQQRNNNALVACDNCLFVLGGFDGKNFLSSVERLQTLHSTWESVAPMLTHRSGVVAVTLNGSIYAIGGRSDMNDVNSRLKTVERYDPKLNEWKYVCEMNYIRSGACAGVLHGKIYVAGGRDVEDKVVKIVECYDPSNDKWKVVKYSKNENENIAKYSSAIVI